jgi:hypothetical protein
MRKVANWIFSHGDKPFHFNRFRYGGAQNRIIPSHAGTAIAMAKKCTLDATSLGWARPSARVFQVQRRLLLIHHTL